MAGNPLSFLTKSQSAPSSSGSWSPTVAYLIILIIAEMVVFGFISKVLR